MTPISPQYCIPEQLDFRDLTSLFKAKYHFLEEPAKRASQQYLDSFDWRIHQAGGRIGLETRGQSQYLTWWNTATGLPLHSMTVESVPGFAWEFPQGAFRKALAPILEMRRLLPVVKVDTKIKILRLLNDEEKTVLRLVLSENVFRSPHGTDQGPLESRLRLVPVKGYDKYLERLSREIDDEIGLSPAKEDLMQAALSGLGHFPGDYSSKLNYHINPDMRADRVAKQIHMGLLKTLEANIAGTKSDLDSEFLHDLRVAVRRTRSALTQIKGVFDETLLEKFKAGFAWLGSITGPTRDMDVYLLECDGYQTSLPEKVRPDLDKFKEFLIAHHQKEQRALARAMNSPRFRKLLKEWSEFLDEPVPDHPLPPNAGRPVHLVADERIYKIYKRVLKEGLAIRAESPPEDLHELRKSCKKLRYLMEFFQSMYPKGEINRLIKVLKVLLDNLGKFQDFEVHATSLQHFGEQMMEEGQASPKTLMAMGILIGDLLKRQQEARSEFVNRFTAFSAAENRQQFKRLFAAEKVSV